MKVHATVALPIGVDRLADLDRAHPGALVIQSGGHLLLVDDEFLKAWNCWCWACFHATQVPGVERFSGFVVCPTCGDKRCGHAGDHDAPCEATP